MSALQIADLDQFKAPGYVMPTGYPPNMRTFYSPEDNVHGALKTVIGSTQRSLVVAMYGYDDDELAEMIDTFLHNDAVYVQLSLDKSQAAGVHERALLDKFAADLDTNSVAIGTSERSAIMHRKMAIVDGLWRISGSTNWSSAGESKQDNELTIVYDASVCAEARPVLDIEHHKMLRQMGRVA